MLDTLGIISGAYPVAVPRAAARLRGESLPKVNEMADARTARKGPILQSAVFVYTRRFPASAAAKKANPISVAPADPRRDCQVGASASGSSASRTPSAPSGAI